MDGEQPQLLVAVLDGDVDEQEAVVGISFDLDATADTGLAHGARYLGGSELEP
jgi:hypothetical protein